MIQFAKLKDAKVISEILIDSIQNEAVTHYENDSDILNYWLSDKAVETIEEQLKTVGTTHFIVKVEELTIGVGSTTKDGEIARCYIKSDFLGHGYGSKLLNHMIDYLDSEIKLIHLFSTIGAISFYEKNDFKQTGKIEMWGPIKMIGMQKKID